LPRRFAYKYATAIEREPSNTRRSRTAFLPNAKWLALGFTMISIA